MTTARALLMRLLTRGRIHPATEAQHEEHRPAESAAEAQLEEHRPAEPAAEQRLDAARERLKQTIPPPEGESPDEGSPAYPGDQPPKA